MVGGAYISIVRHIPAFFSLLYKVGGLISSSTRKSPVYYANSLLAGRLDRYIKEHSFDLILTPHLYAAEVLTCLKHRGLLSVPVIAIGTVIPVFLSGKRQTVTAISSLRRICWENLSTKGFQKSSFFHLVFR